MRKRLLRSRSGFEKPESREEAIMQNILGASNVLEPSESNIEEILKSILYNTPYTKEAEFEIEKILLAIKNNGTYDGEGESRDMKILIAILKDLDYTEEAESRIEELFIEWLHQRSPIKVLEGVPPLTFTSRGLPLINYLIEGNTVQSGTPTPDNPIMPQGTGERTGNLWSNRGFSAITITLNNIHNISNNYGTTLSTTEGDEVTITQSAYPTGNVGYQNGFFMIDVDFSKYAVGDVVTISFDYIVNEVHALSTQTVTTVYAGKNSNPVPAISSSGDWKVSGRLTAVITIRADMNPYVEVRLCGNSITVKNVMLNTGSTALPYEPYGYKIPISSANTTTPVYLGQVQSTRRIKKLVLTGKETIPNNDGVSYNSGTSTDRFVRDIPLSVGDNGILEIILCTHLGFQAQSWVAQTKTGCCIYCSGNTMQLHLRFDNTTLGITQSDTNEQRTEKLKAYLAAQYAAGTPVCVWYALATEETAIVNEPLMKIGNYADSISKEQTGIEIPTENGSNTLDVNTTLKPSNIYIEYK